MDDIRVVQRYWDNESNWRVGLIPFTRFSSTISHSTIQLISGLHGILELSRLEPG